MSITDVVRRLLGRGRQPGAPDQLPRPDDVVVIARPSSEAEAQMMRDMLADEGIAAMVRNRDAASAQAGGVGPSWAYEVWVMRKHAKQAREIVGVAEEPRE